MSKRQRRHPRYLSRDESREYLATLGIKVGKKGLCEHASQGSGPKYAIINGRAMYTQEALDTWIDEQVARPVLRQRRKGG